MFGLGLLAFLIVCWIPAFNNPTNVTWSYMIWFFTIASGILAKSSFRLSVGGLLVAFGLGALALQCSIHAFDWNATRMSLIFVVAALLGILLAGICYKKKDFMVYLLCAVVMIFFNVFFVDAWYDNVLMN